MDFWPEFVAGGCGGMAGVFSGHPLDTLRVRLQQPFSSTTATTSTSTTTSSAFALLRRIISSEGPSALYRGMAAPLASVTVQNAIVFQIYAILARTLDSSIDGGDPPSYRSVALGGVATGALQSLTLCPVELVKINLQLNITRFKQDLKKSPLSIAKEIFRREGTKGIYRGLTITFLRDAPSHGVYFWTYEYTREKLHPGCRKTGEESLKTMLVSGGLAGVASWISCYPLDVIKSRLQAQSLSSLKDQSPPKYQGIIDCLKKSVRAEGYGVLWRGLGTAVTRAFIANGAIFAAYETTLRCFFSKNNRVINQTDD